MPGTNPSTPANIEAAALPDFVRSRIETHTVGRVQQRWAGQHLLRGATPGPDALHLSSNDYLCLATERHTSSNEHRRSNLRRLRRKNAIRNCSV